MQLLPDGNEKEAVAVAVGAEEALKASAYHSVDLFHYCHYCGESVVNEKRCSKLVN